MKYAKRLFLLLLVGLSACDSPLTELPDDPPAGDVHLTDTTITLPGLDNVMLTVAQAQTQFAQDEDGKVMCTVSGYIVGAVDGTSLSQAVFEPPFAVSSNLLLADDAGENDVSRCLPVQLPQNSELCLALNLQTHPENLRLKVGVTGSLERYFRVAGLKSPNAYVVVGNDTPIDNSPDKSDTIYIDR